MQAGRSLTSNVAEYAILDGDQITWRPLIQEVTFIFTFLLSVLLDSKQVIFGRGRTTNKVVVGTQA